MTSTGSAGETTSSVGDLGPERRMTRWVALIAIVAAGLMSVGSVDFCLDDAWIHLSYAKSLRLGDGPSYNPLDRELGFSSPLWMMLLSLLPVTSAPVVSAKTAGILLHALTAVLAGNLAISIGARAASIDQPMPLGSLGLLSGAFVAVQPTLLQAATSGMEVPLAAATLLAAMLAIVEDARPLAFLLGAAAALSRPECGPPLLAFAAVLSIRRTSAAPLLAPLGAAAGVGLWSWYCRAAQGSPWPNTRYAKASAWSLDGLEYLAEEVFTRQPWLLGITGLVAVGILCLAARTNRGLTGVGAIAAAYVVGTLAVAVSRPLHPGVGFYEWRYFTPLDPLPYVLVCLGLTRVSPRAALGLALPVVLVTGLLLPQTHERQRRQEQSISRLHTEVAMWVAREVDPRATLVVEGAGALRFHTPRTMHIVDALGLNDHELIHAGSDAARVCLIADRAPDLFVLPDNVLAPLSGVFQFEEVQTFHEPDYALVSPAHPLTVHVLRSHGLRAPWTTRCETLRAEAASGRAHPKTP